jgi:hypothetical protein
MVHDAASDHDQKSVTPISVLARVTKLDPSG